MCVCVCACVRVCVRACVHDLAGQLGKFVDLEGLPEGGG